MKEMCFIKDDKRTEVKLLISKWSCNIMGDNIQPYVWNPIQKNPIRYIWD